MQQFPEQGTQVLRHDDERESWSFALRKPIPALRSLVHGYCVYEEWRSGTLAHQHLPHPGIPLIVGFEGSLEVSGPIGEPSRIDPGQGFLAGLHTAPALTRSESSQRGVQIDLTPLGAHLLLGGLPMDSIANRSISLEDLLGRAGRQLCTRVAEASNDDATFDLIDAFFAERMLDQRTVVPDGLVFAWNVLNRSHGRRRIAEITKQLGWSRRRLVETFRRTVGLPPKAVARVLRFDHTLELWKADPTTPWSDVAFAGGYADQAHFSREIRQLSGQTPSELAARLLPESGGMLA